MQTYDGIFLGGNTPINSSVLINYVNAGGNVYVMSGTGAFGGNNPAGAASEASQWNTFLNAFGLSYVPFYNTVSGNLPISSSHPIFAGVSTLFHLGGQSISDLAPLDPTQQILINDQSGGLYVVYDMAAVPEPLTLLGVGTALGFGTFFKRKLSKTQDKSANS